MPSIRPYALAVLALFAVSACAKKDAAPAAAKTDTIAPAPAPPMVTASIELGRHLGANKRVSDTTSTFAPRDTFYLAAMTENTPAGAMLTAKWSFQTGQVVDSTTQAVAPTDASSPTAVTEFHLVKPKGWPVGKYKVELFLDGMSKATRDFEVKK